MKKVGRPVKKAVPVSKKKPEGRKHVATQTASKADLDLIIGTEDKDELPLSYWKMLAEARERTIERLIEENEKLKDQMESLERENKLLETIVEDASKIAEFVSSLPDDPDESGIERD